MGRSNFDRIQKSWTRPRTLFNAKSMKFEELPFAIILEICGYLNAEALTALADVRTEHSIISRAGSSFLLTGRIS